MFADTWGSFGSADGQFASPRGVAVNASGEVYVADTGNDRVVQLDRDGRFIRSWGGTGTGDGQFDRPWDVAVNGNQEVYVLDSGNNRVQKFDRNGNFQLTWGSQGGRTGRFRSPKGISADTGNGVWVADTGNDRIQKFNPTGTFQLSIGGSGSGNGRFRAPRDVTVGLAGGVYVADTGNDRIQQFTVGGAFVRAWGSTGTGNRRFNSPQGIYAQGNNYTTSNVFVADTGNDRIVSYTSTGTFEAKWGTSGGGGGQLESPRNVFVDLGDHRFVADTGNSRLEVFDRTYPTRITGTVEGIDGNTPEGPLGGIFVSVSDTTYDLVAIVRTDVNGHYQVDVGAGNAVVAFFDPTGRHAFEYFDDQPDIATATTVVVPDHQSVTVDAVLTETPVTAVGDPGEIAGTVTEGTTPVMPGAGTLVMAIDEAGLPVLTTVADAAGHYEIAGLEAGGYLLLFMDPRGEFATEFFDDTPDPSVADQVVVVGGQTTTVDAHLDP